MKFLFLMSTILSIVSQANSKNPGTFVPSQCAFGMPEVSICLGNLASTKGQYISVLARGSTQIHGTVYKIVKQEPAPNTGFNPNFVTSVITLADGSGLESQAVMKVGVEDGLVKNLSGKLPNGLDVRVSDFSFVSITQ